MDTATARILANMNTAFYGRVASSFSQTRSSAWDGWTEVARLAEDFGLADGGDVNVLDVACGNLRFESFLTEAWPGVDIHFSCLDNCDSLVSEPKELLAEQGLDITYVPCDLAYAFMERGLPSLPAADLAVCFGFFHHLPGADLRARSLRMILEKVRPGGLAVVSFWRFLEDEKLGPKALQSTHRALEVMPELQKLRVDRGDCFLGWQDDAEAFRYCHSFRVEEIAVLAEAVSDIASDDVWFAADGKSGLLNQYVIFRRLY